MGPWKTVAYSAVLSLVGASIAEAQVIANSFDDLMVLVKQGDTISVVNPTGRMVTGKVGNLSTTELVLIVDSQRQVFGETGVETVLRRQKDSLVNGALWGLAIGGGVGLIGAGALGDRLYWSTGAFAAISSAIGAGVGVAVDALISRAQVIYDRRAKAGMRVSPVFGRGRVGTLVSLTF